MVTETVQRLPVPDWARAPAVVRVISALAAAGGAPRFVGGCVRDTVLGRPIGDIDIATPLPPDRVMAALRAAGLRALPTGLAHGTVTALVSDGAGVTQPFEITTLRVDVETDGRHARVAFTDDWRADAARRDFTLNALSLEPDGTLHDPFGGVADARAGRIRFVGDPARRLEEDALRLLRFFRMLAHFGRQPPDAEALAACRAHAPRLAGLSAERVRQELLKLLAAPDPVAAWGWLAEADLAVPLLGEAGDATRLAGLVAAERRAGAAPDPLRRLAALLTGDAEAAALLADRLKLSRRERDRLIALRRHDGALAAALDAALTADLDPTALGRALYDLPDGLGPDLLLLAWAGAPDEDRYPPLLAVARAWVRPRFPLTGADALAAGLAGPAVGTALRAVETWWRDRAFAPDRAACLAELARLAG